MSGTFRSGTMIAFAAATLFATACNKAEDKPSPSTSAPPAASDKAPTAADKAPAAADQTQPAAPEKMAKVHCTGINDCKGKGGCKTAKNDCAGKNSCKGQGFVDVDTADDCQAKGGTVMASN